MKIALLGDIAFYGKYSTANRNIYEYFSDVANILKEFDHVIGNLETPLIKSNFSPYGSKSAHIFSEEENVQLLKYLNIDIVNLANNHIFDYGILGYVNTKRILDANNISYFGIDNKQLKIEGYDSKIALCGYCCYSTNSLGYYDKKKQIGVNILDAFSVEEALIENYNQGYMNITSFHVGQEHINYPNYDHIEMARKLAQKVPYVYYGHHPHVIQGIEEIENSLLAYSLGNFCFDDVYTSKSYKPLIKQQKRIRSHLYYL